MSLGTELGLKKPIALLAHEVLLNTYYTSSLLRKKAGKFLKTFDLTDVQFNLLMMLRHQSNEEGISQVDLSRVMLVNRANITSLIDRMEKAGLVKRMESPSDRREKKIVLTEKGENILSEIEPLYVQRIEKLMEGLYEEEQKRLIEMLEKVRKNIDN